MEYRGTVKGRIFPPGGAPVERTDDQILAERFARNVDRLAHENGLFASEVLARCQIDQMRFDAMRRGDARCPVTFGDLLAVTRHLGVGIEELAR